MKAFKLIDLFGQLALSVFLLLLYPQLTGDNSSYWWWLFALGGWQVVSALVHRLAFKHAFRKGSRKDYNSMLLWAGLVGWFVFPVMLFIGPCMAIWYFITCAVECIQLFPHRPSTFYR